MYQDAEIISILEQLLEGLSYCQVENIMNLNISIENIFVTEDSHYVISGFGQNIYIPEKEKIIFLNKHFDINSKYIAPELCEFFFNKNSKNKQRVQEKSNEVEFKDYLKNKDTIFEIKKVDIYSIGIIILDLMLLQNFNQKTSNIELLKSAEINFPNSASIVKLMISEDPFERLDAFQLLKLIDKLKKQRTNESFYMNKNNRFIKRNVVNISEQKLIEKKKNEIDLLMKKAKIYTTLNKYFSAIEILKQIRKDLIHYFHKDANLIIEISFQMGFCYLKNSYFTNAIKEFILAKELIMEELTSGKKDNLKQESAINSFYLAESYFYCKKYEEAIEEINYIWDLLNLDIEIDINSYFLYYELEGKIWSDLDNHEKSIKIFESLNKIISNNISFKREFLHKNEKIDIVDKSQIQIYIENSLIFLAKEYFYSGQLEKSFEILESAWKMQSNDNKLRTGEKLHLIR